MVKSEPIRPWEVMKPKNKRGPQPGMVDISEKNETKRTANATARVKLGRKAFQTLMKDGSPKGNVFETAKIAGIQAAKATSTVIPLCHPLALNKVSVDFEHDRNRSTVTIKTEVNCLGRTGVEMEALTAASVAALTIYDMMKWADKGIIISDVKLLRKTGGKSGDYKRSHGKRQRS